MANNGRIREVTEDMRKKKIKQTRSNRVTEKNNFILIDMDLPRAPKLEIYHETFGDLKNITEKWYKENRA